MISRQLVEVNKISRADSVIRATCCRSFAGKKKPNKNKTRKGKDWNQFKSFALLWVLAVWAQGDLRQNQGLSISQICISDKQPVAKRSPSVTGVNLGIKETSVQVEEVMSSQGFHQKDHLQSCTHWWDVANSPWETSPWPSRDSSMLCISQIQARSFLRVAESSKPWWGARGRRSSHESVEKQLLALLWAA